MPSSERPDPTQVEARRPTKPSTTAAMARPSMTARSPDVLDAGRFGHTTSADVSTGCAWVERKPSSDLGDLDWLKSIALAADTSRLLGWLRGSIVYMPPVCAFAAPSLRLRCASLAGRLDRDHRPT